MPLVNYHTHTTYCDGKNTPEEMILAAISEGFSELGFSTHSPIYGANYSIRRENLPRYVSELRELSVKYSDRIKIYVGIEADILSDIDLSEFDYVIGSAHFVCPEGKYFDVDRSALDTRNIISEFYHGDPYAYCEAYFAEAAKIYKRTNADIIGHFDLLTKFIEVDPIFSIRHPRYIAARDSALSELLSTPAVFEVNTGAISRGYRTSPYPDTEVLKAIKAKGKGVVVNSDSHAAATLSTELESTARRLSEMGITCYSDLESILKITRKNK